jgi:hypothetical protein
VPAWATDMEVRSGYGYGEPIVGGMSIGGTLKRFGLWCCEVSDLLMRRECLTIRGMLRPSTDGRIGQVRLQPTEPGSPLPICMIAQRPILANRRCGQSATMI